MNEYREVVEGAGHKLFAKNVMAEAPVHGKTRTVPQKRKKLKSGTVEPAMKRW